MGFLSLFGISNTTDKWLVHYAICSDVVLNNSTYLLWFQASEENAGFSVVWMKCSCAYRGKTF